MGRGSVTALIDLTREISEGMPVYPGDPLFQARPFADYGTDGFRATRFTIGSHLGTHVDAPSHYFVDGETLDAFPVDFFCGSCVCLNLASVVGPESPRYAARIATGRPASLNVDDLAPFEPLFEDVPMVLLRFDWAQKFGVSDFYDDFPSLSPELCDWLADYPKLRILGLETPSLVSAPPRSGDAGREFLARDAFDPEFADLLPKDPAPLETGVSLPEDEPEREPLDELELNADAECHRILLGRRPPILILEGLVRLERLPSYAPPASNKRVERDPSRVFTLSCLPLPIKGADGSPARVVAKTLE